MSDLTKQQWKEKLKEAKELLHEGLLPVVGGDPYTHHNFMCQKQERLTCHTVARNPSASSAS